MLQNATVLQTKTGILLKACHYFEDQRQPSQSIYNNIMVKQELNQNNRNKLGNWEQGKENKWKRPNHQAGCLLRPLPMLFPVLHPFPNLLIASLFLMFVSFEMSLSGGMLSLTVLSELAFQSPLTTPFALFSSEHLSKSVVSCSLSCLCFVIPLPQLKY